MIIEEKHLKYLHSELECAGDYCPVHNPSDHPLNSARMNWRQDKGQLERLCDHGIGHPDPDDLDYKRRTFGLQMAAGLAIHGCCGCCSGGPIS